MSPVPHVVHLMLRSTIAVLFVLYSPEGTGARGCNVPLTVALDIGHSPSAPGTPSATGKTEYSFNRRFVLEMREAGAMHSSLKFIIINSEALDIGLPERTKIAKDQA